MATSKVNPDADAIVSQMQIAAKPERVFQALTDPEQVVQWWGQNGVYRTAKFHADLRPGGEWRAEGVGPDGGSFNVNGEYLEIEPPRLLVHTWVASWTGAVKTVVRWELESTTKGTSVKISHSGLAAHPEVAQNYRGWPRMLTWLQALLETGETVNDRKPLSAG